MSIVDFSKHRKLRHDSDLRLLIPYKLQIDGLWLANGAIIGVPDHNDLQHFGRIQGELRMDDCR